MSRISNDKKFFVTELILSVLAVAMLLLMFGDRRERKQVTVIVSNPDSGGWTSFLKGMKQSAQNEGVDLVIAGTGMISGAAEEGRLIQEEVSNGADALIVQPAPGSLAADILSDAARRVPMMLVDSRGSWAESGNVSDLPYVSMDNFACGEALAQQLLSDYAGNLSGKTIGIINLERNRESAVNREKGFLDGIRNSGADVLWTLYTQTGILAEGELERNEKVDLVIGLSNSCTESAGAASERRKIRGALVYGIGSSARSLYYLDHDHIRGLIVPDGFDMGYRSLQETARKLRNRWYSMKSYDIAWREVHKADLFQQGNEELLFMEE